MFPICTAFDGSDPAEETAVLMSFTRRASWVEAKAGCRVVSMVAIARRSNKPRSLQVSSVGNLISMLPSFMHLRVVNDNHLALMVRRGVGGSISRPPETGLRFPLAIIPLA